MMKNIAANRMTHRCTGTKQVGIPNPPKARRTPWGKGPLLTAVCLLLAISWILPAAGFGEAAEAKTVRVGWYDSPFNYMDQFGRRSGYAYEYQQKIAAYTGWTYEYVEDTWPNLLHMLEAGEIDLMSDISYTPERAEVMLYASLPMGTETYYAFISNDNKIGRAHV